MNGSAINSVVSVVALCLISMTSAHADVVELWGDQSFDDVHTWSGNHYKIHGNLTVGLSGELTIEDSTIEMMCSYDREFAIVVEGTLRTTNCVVGGTILYAASIHSMIRIQGGWWYATDTTVQYTYGIVFHSNKPSYLRAMRLTAGVNSDSIIIGGRADVIITDSTYHINVKCDTSAGGTTTLEFPVGTPITKVYDKNNCPGADYRMELINTRVSIWFLWLSNVSSDGPITTYNLQNCPSLIISLECRNLIGNASLPACYDVESDRWFKYLPANTHVSIGSLRINTLNDRVNLTCWAIYLNGKSTDFTINGSTNIAELQTRGGAVCRVFGDSGTHNAYLSCTTIDSFHDSGIVVGNATLGGLDSIGNIGQISAHDSSLIVFEDCLVGNTLLIPRDGDIEFINCTKYGASVEVTELPGKGQISWSYRPAAHYGFEGDALDREGNNHGTVYGASFVPGQVGSLAAHFDGIDDYIEIPRVVSDDFTIAFWIKTASTANTGSWYAGDGLIDGMDGYSTNDFGTALLGSKFCFAVGVLGRRDFINIVSSTDVNDDLWHHVVAARYATTGNMKIYVDGTEQANAVGPTGPKNAASVLRVGCLGPGLNFFTGDIDDLRLYNHVLGAMDLAHLADPNNESPTPDNPFTERFETGDFDRFDWLSFGDNDWTVTSEEHRTGTYCAKAGSIDDNESTTLEVTLDCISSEISFFYKVSSEQHYDYLRFYIDGTLQDEWTGNENWTQVSFPVRSGRRTFEWTYSKDDSSSYGSDTVWIDDIEFPCN